MHVKRMLASLMAATMVFSSLNGAAITVKAENNNSNIEKATENVAQYYENEKVEVHELSGLSEDNFFMVGSNMWKDTVLLTEGNFAGKQVSIDGVSYTKLIQTNYKNGTTGGSLEEGTISFYCAYNGTIKIKAYVGYAGNSISSSKSFTISRGTVDGEDEAIAKIGIPEQHNFKFYEGPQVYTSDDMTVVDDIEVKAGETYHITGNSSGNAVIIKAVLEYYYDENSTPVLPTQTETSEAPQTSEVPEIPEATDTNNIPEVPEPVVTEDVPVEKDSKEVELFQGDISRINKYSKIYFGKLHNDFRTADYRWSVVGIEDDALVLLENSKGRLLNCSNGLYGGERYVYEGSLIDKELCALYEGDEKSFTDSEIDLMKAVNIDYYKEFVDDGSETIPVNNIGSITRKMYLPNIGGISTEGIDHFSIYVGKNLGNIRVPLGAAGLDSSYAKCWIRGGYHTNVTMGNYYGMGEYIGHWMMNDDTNFNIHPVMHLNYKTVLFASSAKTVSEDATVDIEAATLRFDSQKDCDGNYIEDRIKSEVTVEKDGITVTKASEGEYLYVVWKDDNGDNVKSYALAENEKAYFGELQGIKNITEDYKIWIEREEDNLIYARLVEQHKHEWKYTVEGNKIEVFCNNADKAAISCGYTKENSIAIEVVPQKICYVNNSYISKYVDESAWVEAGFKLPEVIIEKAGNIIENKDLQTGSDYKACIICGDETDNSVVMTVDFEVVEEPILKDVFGNVLSEYIGYDMYNNYEVIRHPIIYFGNYNYKWFWLGNENGAAILMSMPDRNNNYNYGTSIYNNNSSMYKDSILDKYIMNLYKNGSKYFTASQVALMRDVDINYTIYYDSPAGVTKTITRKMYAPNLVNGKVYVGSGDGKYVYNLDSVNWLDASADFWLRTAEFNEYSERSFANTASVFTTSYSDVSTNHNVIPVLHMELMPVLFASKARAVTTTDVLEDVYTLRFISTKDVSYDDVADRIISQAVAYTDCIKVTNSVQGEYLYIQWKDEDGEHVKSFALDGVKDTYRMEDLTVGITADTKVWIEKKDITDNLVYARMVEFANMPLEPVIEKNGLVFEDGLWKYYVNNVIDYDYNGLVYYLDNYFYVVNGVVDFSYTGLAAYNGYLFSVTNGMLDTGVNTLVFYNGDWYNVINGFVDFNYTNLVYFGDAWFYVSGGKVDFDYTGLVLYGGAWFYIENGILNWAYTGLCEYGGYLYYVENGVLNGNLSGVNYLNGRWYYLENGIVAKWYTSLAIYDGIWFYVNQGVLDFSYTGLANYAGIWFYVANGILDTGYTGLANYDGIWFYVANGMLDTSYTGLVNYMGIWFYVSNGVLDVGYRGLVMYGGAWFYVAYGQIDWNYNGICMYDGYNFYVSGGIVTGLA